MSRLLFRKTFFPIASRVKVRVERFIIDTDANPNDCMAAVYVAVHQLRAQVPVIVRSNARNDTMCAE